MRLEDLAPLAITLVITGVVLSIGTEIMDDVHDDISGETGRNIVNNTTAGLEELASWMDTIALVAAAAVVLGVIFFAFSRIGRA